MSSPSSIMPQSAPPPERPPELVRLREMTLTLQDFAMCRRNSFCISCCRAFCSHCCAGHHAHSDWAVSPVVRVVVLFTDGRLIFDAPNALQIPRFVKDIMAAQDYTSWLSKDAFCLLCETSFCTDVCPHHDHHRLLSDAVIHLEEREGQIFARCKGNEWWFEKMMALRRKAAAQEQQSANDKNKQGCMFRFGKMFGLRRKGRSN